MTTETTAIIAFNFITICCGSMMTYLGLDKEAILLFSILLVIDYITGVAKACRLKHSITSNRMKYGLISKFSLILVPIVLAIGAKAVGVDFKAVLMVGVNILILSEVYSIIGNIYSIRTKEELPEYDAVAMLGHKIRNTLLKYSEDGK